MKDYSTIIGAIDLFSLVRKKFGNTFSTTRSLFLCIVIGTAPSLASFKTTTVSAKTSSLTSSQVTCESGAYTSEKGEMVVLLPRQTRHFRYVFTDGRWGNTADANPLAYCSEGKVFVKRPSGVIETWKHVPLRLTRTHFVSDGLTLSGMLVEPVNAQDKPPLLVQVHGSNNTGWINGQDEWGHEAYSFAAHGISTFVFDKRGRANQLANLRWISAVWRKMWRQLPPRRGV